jgi:FAD/FMN-containing dehydrogenase
MAAAIPGFRGVALTASDAAYDDARRIWNGAIDRRPAVIARGLDHSDVAAAIRYARERDLPIAVRGGGHGVGGFAAVDGGLVIDLSAMRGVHVDARARRAWVGGGALWGDVDAGTQAYGLATVGGIVTHTGVGGLTLGGGLGWLMRTHGLAVDHLRSARVVTAGGDALTASETEHPDLFWALRGGGGNFGVVTSFEFDLHRRGPVLAGPLAWPLEDAPALLRHYREFIERAPDELATIVVMRHAPAGAPMPPSIHGRPVCLIIVCWTGEHDAGERAIAPLRRFGRPLFDGIAARPYVELQSAFDAGAPHGWHSYWKSCELPALTDQTIDLLTEHANRIESPRSYIIMFHMGGAVARVAEEATAYSQRAAVHNVNIDAVWLPAEEHRAEREPSWARTAYEALAPHQLGVYVNFLGDEGQERVRSAYGKAKYQQLAEIKARYDPENVFRLNQNIRPAESALGSSRSTAHAMR